MTICEKDLCCGCMACMNTCPSGAITRYTDGEGFWFPEVDDALCTGCNSCRRVCPVHNVRKNDTFQKKVFACNSLSDETLLDSSSGGLFTEIAKLILSKNGVVFGAVLDDCFRVIHSSVSTESGLARLRGSKYVQSDMKDVFPQIKGLLESGRIVLFSGTPCQVAALYNFVGENRNLYTCDIICHGVPSPMFFEDYKRDLEKRYKSEICDIKFRYKKPCWEVFSMKVLFKNGQEYTGDAFNDPFLRGFLTDRVSRPSCHACRFTNLNRQGDVTIADFWRYIPDDEHPLENRKNGISLLMLNNEKGQAVFEEIASRIRYVAKPVYEAVNGNLCLAKPYEPSWDRSNFWVSYRQRGYQYCKKRYLRPKNYVPPLVAALNKIVTKYEYEKYRLHDKIDAGK